MPILADLLNKKTSWLTKYACFVNSEDNPHLLCGIVFVLVYVDVTVQTVMIVSP